MTCDKLMKTSFNILLLLMTMLASCQISRQKEKVKILPPEELYGQLFFEVQSNENIFSDSKTFVDCVPLDDVDEIREEYTRLNPGSDSAIIRFIKKHFRIPGNNLNYVSDSASISTHITKLWNVLKRPADEKVSGTLIPLPYPYIVPGGRFREIYYWDSYFTMLGLQADHQTGIIQHMVDNFSYLIDTRGFIPNGNRTYYLSRSQPPFYALMVSLLADMKGDTIYSHYLKDLEREYAFWMNGADRLNAMNQTSKHVVRLAGGEILNRYWDDKATPRPESYREDVKTAEEAAIRLPGIKKEVVFRNLRAAAESGWDFSSRWLDAGEGKNFPLYTIHTTDIIPVDLNALLCNLERTLSLAFKLNGDPEKAENFKKKYEARKKALISYCWNEKEGFFMDFNFKTGQQTDVFSLAGVYPLFFNIADQQQADRVSEKVESSFLKAGGIVTTLNRTGQQWDAPNGWAPLQWITIQGLRNYRFDSQAATIRDRWLDLNRQVYNQTYKIVEKYNVEDLSHHGGGGEYPNQDGFGWSNGVFQKLWKEGDRKPETREQEKKDRKPEKAEGL